MTYRIDRELYPFEPHYLEVEGGRVHYVDEGRGPALVMEHGTPTWSFLYRHLIRDLSRTHRVVAMDNLGFGLSHALDNPANVRGLVLFSGCSFAS
jgi:haloalkane dehalogenase